MAKMSLIVFKETGHVLGAFTRTADPEGTVTSDQVVGDGLVLRDPDSGDERVTVAPQHLKVETIDRRDDVILSHQDYVLEDGIATERSAITGGTPVAYNRTSRTLTITVQNSLNDDGTAWVHIGNSQTDPVVVPIDITENTATGDTTVTLAPGDYGVLMVAPEHRAYLSTLTVT